jgi:hypothetical protein
MKCGHLTTDTSSYPRCTEYSGTLLWKTSKLAGQQFVTIKFNTLRHGHRALEFERSFGIKWKINMKFGMRKVLGGFGV